MTRARAHRTGPRGLVLLDPPVRGRRIEAPPDLTVVMNADATRFSAEAIRSALDAAFGARGLRHRIVEVGGRGPAARTVAWHVARALADGCTRIVAAGGDGTVAMVAQCLVRMGTRSAPATLGIIPAGTANVLARELGLPLQLDAAVDVVADAPRALELDAILVGKRYVFTQVGIGPDALMIRDTSRERQARMGRLAYLLTFARRAFGHRSTGFTLRLDGATVRERAWQLIVANAGALGAPPFTYGPRIDPTDGVLDLCLYRVRGPGDYARLLWRILLGRHRKDEKTRFYRVRDRAAIRSDRPLLVQGDGEVIGTTPITLRTVPRALRVIVGARADAIGPPAGEGSVAAEMKGMIAEQHSRTWVLQGVLRHPLAALEALDAALFLKVNALELGPAADRVLWTVSRFLHYGEGWAAAALVVLAADFRTGLETVLQALPALWATMLTVNYGLKRIFRRRRPFLAYVKARVVGPRPRDFSFPSGHAAAGFAGAILFSLQAPAWTPLFYLFALVVAFSRIYLGMHYPSDVVMGAAAGTALALAYQAVIRLALTGAG